MYIGQDGFVQMSVVVYCCNDMLHPYLAQAFFLQTLGFASAQVENISCIRYRVACVDSFGLLFGLLSPWRWRMCNRHANHITIALMKAIACHHSRIQMIPSMARRGTPQTPRSHIQLRPPRASGHRGQVGQAELRTYGVASATAIKDQGHSRRAA